MFAYLDLHPRSFTWLQINCPALKDVYILVPIPDKNDIRKVELKQQTKQYFQEEKKKD